VKYNRKVLRVKLSRQSSLAVRRGGAKSPSGPALGTSGGRGKSSVRPVDAAALCRMIVRTGAPLLWSRAGRLMNVLPQWPVAPFATTPARGQDHLRREFAQGKQPGSFRSRRASNESTCFQT
jgi:hypothetical protein